jgi:hypothetical protein
MAGSVTDVNSLSDPTGDLFVSVVCRIRGKSANRTKGTESSAPTNAEPTASNAPRKDRRFCREGSAVVDFKVNPSEFAAHISTLRTSNSTKTAAPLITPALSSLIYFFGNARM